MLTFTFTKLIHFSPSICHYSTDECSDSYDKTPFSNNNKISPPCSVSKTLIINVCKVN